MRFLSLKSRVESVKEFFELLRCRVGLWRDNRGSFDLGSETMLWIYRFVLITLVVLVVMFIVHMHFGKEIDVSGLEAVVLSERVGNCFFSEGEFLLEEFNSERVEECFGDAGVWIRVEMFDGRVLEAVNSEGEFLEPLCGSDKVYCYFLRKYVNADGVGGKMDARVMVSKV